MYSYVSAFAVSKVAGSQWSSVDLSSTSLENVFLTYRSCYFELSNPFITGNVYFDFENLRTQYSTSTLTIVDFLTANADTTLTTVTTIPFMNPKYCAWSDAFRSGFHIKPVDMTKAFDAPLLSSDKPDLALWKISPYVDSLTVKKYCLASVNGFFHYTDGDINYYYVKDGGKSLLKSHQNQLGLLSFYNIGDITLEMIDPINIVYENNTTLQERKVYAKCTTDFTNKTVLMVIGGYLHFPDSGFFKQTGDDIFCVDLNKLNILERYFEAEPYLDFSDLQLPVSINNSDQIGLSDFYSENTIKKYFSMSTTFFVVVNTPMLFTNKIHVRHSQFPGMFTAYGDRPTYPLFTSNGRLAEYWVQEEDTQWAVNVYDSYWNQRVFSTLSEKEFTTTAGQRIPLKTFYDARGYFLEIGRDY
jgi:hypothetical protein